MASAWSSRAKNTSCSCCLYRTQEKSFHVKRCSCASGACAKGRALARWMCIFASCAESSVLTVGNTLKPSLELATDFNRSALPSPSSPACRPRHLAAQHDVHYAKGERYEIRSG